MKSSQNKCSHFVSYSGFKLPLTLVTPLDDAGVENRITYFRGYYDELNRLITCEKVVYGEIEFVHEYEYYANGRLKQAKIIEADEEPRSLCFDEHGAVVTAP